MGIVYTTANQKRMNVDFAYANYCDFKNRKYCDPHDFYDDGYYNDYEY